MKRAHLLLAGVMCYVLLFKAHAQLLPSPDKLLPEKALLFAKLPEQFIVSNLWIEKLFAGPDSGAVKILLAANNYFEGVVTAKVQVNANVTNINIKSTNYDGAMLSLSKITRELTTKYIGRIISIHYGDVFLLTQEDNTLYFRKKKQSVVITE